MGDIAVNHAMHKKTFAEHLEWCFSAVLTFTLWWITILPKMWHAIKNVINVIAKEPTEPLSQEWMPWQMQFMGFLMLLVCIAGIFGLIFCTYEKSTMVSLILLAFGGVLYTAFMLTAMDAVSKKINVGT